MAAEFHRRVLIAEDEEFTLNLLSELLGAADFEVMAVATVSEAISQIESFDPHAVITDLNFGVTGPSGADLLDYLDKNNPWIGKVILTSHASPNLAVQESISKSSTPAPARVDDGGRIVVSHAQGEILLLIAEGLTNAAIARKRGTSLRATETLVQRTFAVLGLKNDEDFNPRVLAVRMWQHGKVVVK